MLEPVPDVVVVIHNGESVLQGTINEKDPLLAGFMASLEISIICLGVDDRTIVRQLVETN